MQKNAMLLSLYSTLEVYDMMMSMLRMSSLFLKALQALRAAALVAGPSAGPSPGPSPGAAGPAPGVDKVELGKHFINAPSSGSIYSQLAEGQNCLFTETAYCDKVHNFL